MDENQIFFKPKLNNMKITLSNGNTLAEVDSFTAANQAAKDVFYCRYSDLYYDIVFNDGVQTSGSIDLEPESFHKPHEYTIFTTHLQTWWGNVSRLTTPKPGLIPQEYIDFCKTLLPRLPDTKHYKVSVGTSNNGQTVTTLYKTHYHDGTPLIERIYIKAWYDEKELAAKIYSEMELNDWSRWNTELVEGKTVEVSEYIYYNMLGAVPPKIMKAGYFEVGEPHHYDFLNKKEVHRAFWMQNGKYYTGYPKLLNSVVQ